MEGGKTINREVRGRVVSDELENARWLVDCPEYDEGFTFCYDCAVKVKNNRDDVLIDGGWITEEDSPPICEKCHKSLACSILPSGELLNTEQASNDWIDVNP